MTATYQVLVDDMKALGIAQVFGLMSDDTAVFATALDSSGIRFYGARHENNAIAMAEGYSYGTGGLGVAVIGRGPATANGLHATTYASRSGSRVLIIFGEQAASSGAVNTLGPDYKGFNSTGVLGAAGIRTFVATSPETARGALADAANAALQGGAVALLLPVNVQLAELDLAKAAPPPALAPPRPPAPPRAQAIEAAAALLRQSRKPVILAGLGAHRAVAKAEIEQLADRIGALLATTARGKDMFRGHPANLGIVGSFSHSAARRMIDQADCVVVFGAGLNLLTMSFGHSLPKVPLIQVDADRSHIGRWHPADVAVVGDARLAAQALLEALPPGSNADRPFRSDETLRFLAISTSRATSSRRARRAPSTRARSARRSRSCCRRDAISSTTPATSWESCPIFPCRDRATSS